MLELHGINRLPGSWPSQFDWIKQRLKGKAFPASLMKIYWCAASYHLWKERNRRLHEAGFIPLSTRKRPSLKNKQRFVLYMTRNLTGNSLTWLKIFIKKSEKKISIRKGERICGMQQGWQFLIQTSTTAAPIDMNLIHTSFVAWLTKSQYFPLTWLDRITKPGNDT